MAGLSAGNTRLGGKPGGSVTLGREDYGGQQFPTSSCNRVWDQTQPLGSRLSLPLPGEGYTDPTPSGSFVLIGATPLFRMEVRNYLWSLWALGRVPVSSTGRG